MALLNSIVTSLKIPKEFLTRYSPVMREKFREASRKFKTSSSSDDGINQCLHLASSVILRQEPADVEDALRAASAAIKREPELHSKDPDIILTIATVYYLLHEEPQLKVQEEAEDFLRVEQAFAAKDWLIGKDAMNKLLKSA
jgi:hypothetical protein